MKYGLSFILALIFLTGCKSIVEIPRFQVEKSPEKPDYTLTSSWAVLPTKYTRAFQEYASKEIDTLQADVFYVYPTLNLEKEDIRWNVPINDTIQNKKVIQKAVLMLSLIHISEPTRPY